MKRQIIKESWRPIGEAEDCEAEARTAGFCPRHYQQIRRHGRLTPEREYSTVSYTHLTLPTKA